MSTFGLAFTVVARVLVTRVSSNIIIHQSSGQVDRILILLIMEIQIVVLVVGVTELLE